MYSMLSTSIWRLNKHILAASPFTHQIRIMSSQPAKRQRSKSSAASSPSVDVSEFDDIVQELSNYDQQRETVRVLARSKIIATASC